MVCALLCIVCRSVEVVESPRVVQGGSGGSRCWSGSLQLSTTGASWGSAALIALSFCAAEGYRCSFLGFFCSPDFFRFYNQTPQESVRVSCSWCYLLFLKINYKSTRHFSPFCHEPPFFIASPSLLFFLLLFPVFPNNCSNYYMDGWMKKYYYIHIMHCYIIMLYIISISLAIAIYSLHSLSVCPCHSIVLVNNKI